MTNITQALSDLIKSGQDLTQNTKATPQEFQTYDLYPFFINDFTDKAKKALNIKTYYTVYEWDELVPGKSYPKYMLARLLSQMLKTFDYDIVDDLYPFQRHFTPCRFFGTVATKAEIAQAGLKLVTLINDLADKDYILATLAPLTAINLADGRIAVLTYLCIRDTGDAYVNTNYSAYQHGEGEMPKTLQEIP